jgi:hypothetical protein
MKSFTGSKQMSIRMKKISFLVIFFLIGLVCRAQTVYLIDINSKIYSYDVSTCTSTQIFQGHGFSDMAIDPTGNIIFELLGGNLWRTNIATQTTVFLGNNPSIFVTGLEYSPDGFLYWLGTNLYRQDPMGGPVTLIGSLPAGWNCRGDLVYQNGNYYATIATLTQNFLALVNITNPSASTILCASPSNLVAGAAVSHPTCPKQYWFSGSKAYEFDLTTLIWTQICFGFSINVGGGASPLNYSFPYSCCPTNAGTISTASQNLCVPLPALATYNNNANLGSTSLLEYVIYSDASDPKNSIKSRSNTSSVPYNPLTMQPNTVYYLATMAGNGVAGQVNLADPCLSFSIPAQVTWKAQPTVVFSTPNVDVCAGGCKTVNVSFTGAPPFTLLYMAGTSSTLSQTFSTNTGTIQVCAGANAPVGALNIQATRVVDANCVCN